MEETLAAENKKLEEQQARVQEQVRKRRAEEDALKADMARSELHSSTLVPTARCFFFCSDLREVRTACCVHHWSRQNSAVRIL